MSVRPTTVDAAATQGDRMTRPSRYLVWMVVCLVAVAVLAFLLQQQLVAAYSHNPALNTVRLAFAGKPRFSAGGQLVVVGSRPTGVASPTGIYLEGNTGTSAGADGLYKILPNGRGMTG